MQRSRLYLVATGDGSDPQHAACRRTGLRLARDDGARVVLYDRSSESALVDPYPAGNIDPRSDTVSRASVLDDQSLRALGREYLVDQLAEARDMGLEVDAYLAEGTGVDAVVEAIELRRPDVVVLPAAVVSDSLLDRLRGDTAVNLAEKVAADIVFVDGDGNRVQP